MELEKGYYKGSGNSYYYDNSIQYSSEYVGGGSQDILEDF
jgi:hypothetical protein